MGTLNPGLFGSSASAFNIEAWNNDFCKGFF